MAKLGKVSWQKFEKFLLKVGCEFIKQEGDHRKYRRPGLLRPVIIPRDKELPAFIIQNNLRTLGISKEEYQKIMRNA
jgi:predicted RNA binding protein YcfA (HicA-like mRNA interferase family)